MISTIFDVAFYLAIFALIIFLWSLGGFIRYVSNDMLAIVEKRWALKGSVKNGLIALNGEAGYQPDVIRGGLHFFTPFQYRLHKVQLVTIPLSTMAYVYARDGLPLPPSQTLAANRSDHNFEDVRSFLAADGQRGPQRKILREGTYAINLIQFVILAIDGIHAINLSEEEAQLLEGMRKTIIDRDGFRPVQVRVTDDRSYRYSEFQRFLPEGDVLYGPDDPIDPIAIVTVQDGPALASGEIIASEIEGHQSFQDPDVFLAAGGHRGRQHQVLADGTYYINRLFATVEIVPKLLIKVGNVGVVVSYIGEHGTDISGDDYRHGELVTSGNRGVWSSALLPGKYAWNFYAGRVLLVPVTNFVLKWVSGEAGGHELDRNLSEITLITKDAFEPILPLSVVVHIDYQKAPEVIQRFGDVRRLIEQTLDPMISAYFKNIGQTMTLIELLQKRTEIQQRATVDMRERFAAYSLELQEVLIGTPRASGQDQTLETILVQLRTRQIAVEQQETYRLQEAAAVTERSLNEAKSAAAMQSNLTQSKIAIQVAENNGSANLAQARKDAERTVALAEAEARRIFVEGEATANAAKLQVDAYGGPEFRLSQEIARAFFDAIQQGHQPVVPQILVNNGAEGGGSVGSLLTSLLASSLIKRPINVELPT